jgi:hypothetical protein
MQKPIITNTIKKPTATYAKNKPIVTKSDSSGSFTDVLLVKEMVTFSTSVVRFIIRELFANSFNISIKKVNFFILHLVE